MITTTSRRLVTGVICVVAAGLLAGCTTVVDGRVRGASGVPARSGSVSPSASPTSPDFPSGSASPSTTAPTGPYARVPATTVVGDAATLDFCKAVSPDAIRVPGWTATLSADQFPPGCYLDLKRGSSTVSISAGVYSSATRGGSHRTSTLSGLTTYLYAYDKVGGYCPRIVRARGLDISINAYPGAGNVRSQAVSCGGTDAVAKQLAAAVAADTVPALPLASPSVTALDSCKVLRASSAGKQPALARLSLSDTQFGVACYGSSSTVYFSVYLLVAARSVPSYAKPVTVGGHRLYSSSGTSKIFCDFSSVQGRTEDGHYEQLTISASARNAKKPPAQLCTQTGLAAAAYLDTAGLK